RPARAARSAKDMLLVAAPWNSATAASGCTRWPWMSMSETSASASCMVLSVDVLRRSEVGCQYLTVHTVNIYEPARGQEASQRVDIDVHAAEEISVDPSPDDLAHRVEVPLPQRRSRSHGFPVIQADDLALDRYRRLAVVNLVPHERVQDGCELLAGAIQPFED